MEWTKQFFDKTWLEYGFCLVTPEQTRQQVSFIESALRLKPKEKLLDICCGIGRHSIPLAQQGYLVTGIDFKPEYLTKAQAEAFTLKNRPAFLEADMRKLPFVNLFDAAICIWSSFGYFDEEADLGILKGVAKALKKGGRFLIDVANRDYILRHFRERDWTKAGKGYIMERRIFHVDKSLIVTTWVFAGEGHIVLRTSEMRLYSLIELESMLVRAGFRVSERFGDFNRARPSIETPRLILVAST
ncbi:MAG: class I SAM-dependent methyltransferase [Candidatus Aureabacteria bacterium]|nr:class I SAM-dependent methyltransferase [Candidatus Auribacterota bacterium]